MNVKYTIVDVGGLKTIEIIVNGKTIQTLTEEDIADNAYNFTGSFNLEEQNGTNAHKVQIKVTDLAGNVTDTNSEDFLKAHSEDNENSTYVFFNEVTVSRNFFVRWYANTGLFWGSIAGVVVLVLNCNDTNEYSAMFGHCKATPKENAGRGLCVREKKILEYQVAMFGKSDKEAERSQELKEFIVERNAQCTAKAVKIPMIPEKLSLAETMSENVAAFRTQGIIPIGMDFGTVALTSINMASGVCFFCLNICYIKFVGASDEFRR